VYTATVPPDALPAIPEVPPQIAATTAVQPAAVPEMAAQMTPAVAEAPAIAGGLERETIAGAVLVSGEPAPVRVRWAARAAAAALGHVSGALAGQVLALLISSLWLLQPFHTLILTALGAYLGAFYVAALLTQHPAYADRGRYIRGLSDGALIAASGMEAALIASGVLLQGYAAWEPFAIAAVPVFTAVWLLTLSRWKRAVKQKR
jgi:hypothetical protein